VVQSEGAFQARLIRELREKFPGCIVLKNDSGYLPGVPDLTILWRKKWAALECKASPSSRRGPNQQYYIDLMSRMSFAAFIYPANKERVLHDLQLAFKSQRGTRVSGTE
jgi:hypothetical protein